jgi:hypothetical protein
MTTKEKAKEYCFRCGNQVTYDEVSPDYYAYCEYCDEDMYSFEIRNKKFYDNYEKQETK